MADLVVTVPKNLWFDWIDEGDAVGAPETGETWGFYLGTARPPIERGERLYIVSWGRLRGYAPVTDVKQTDDDRWAILRRGGAVAVTIHEDIPGFRGYRRAWWHREAEVPFPDWKTAGLPQDIVATRVRRERERLTIQRWLSAGLIAGATISRGAPDAARACRGGT